MTQVEAEKAFYVWCVKMRLAGVHPDWFPVWLGANKDIDRLAVWVNGPGCSWPTEAHFKAPEGEFYTSSFKRGLPLWEWIKERVRDTYHEA